MTEDEELDKELKDNDGELSQEFLDKHGLKTWEQVKADLDRIRRKEYEGFGEWFKFEIYYPLSRFLSDVKWGILWRTTKRYNVVHMPSLKPRYYDQDTRLLHACFDLLVDHLEEEAVHSWWSENRKREKEGQKKFSKSYFRKNTKEFVMMHLDWEISLDNPDDPNMYCPDQAEAARVKKELYLWWKEQRPNRVDPWSQEDLEGHAAMDLENQQYEEDNEMLKKLINVRRTMWV